MNLKVRRICWLFNHLEGLFTLDPFMDKPESNVEKIMRMKQVLKVAMQFSLTDRQKEVIELYYLDDKKAVDIAKEWGISRQYIKR